MHVGGGEAICRAIPDDAMGGASCRFVGEPAATFWQAYPPERPVTDDHVVKYGDVQQRPHLDRLRI